MYGARTTKWFRDPRRRDSLWDIRPTFGQIAPCLVRLRDLLIPDSKDALRLVQRYRTEFHANPIDIPLEFTSTEERDPDEFYTKIKNYWIRLPTWRRRRRLARETASIRTKVSNMVDTWPMSLAVRRRTYCCKPCVLSRSTGGFNC